MLKCLLVIASLILISSAFAQVPDVPKEDEWLTLRGQVPIVIARGGLSGVFPESSPYANQLALVSSLSSTALFCNVQLTKDGVGICLTDLRLQNSTNIEEVFPRAQKSYKINGKVIKGWFSVDYLAESLLNSVGMIQSVLSRPSIFDNTLPIAAVEDIIGIKPGKVWLNADHESFYQEHNLSVTSYIQKALDFRLMRVNFVSSSEIGILKDLSGSVNNATTKLIFRMLEANEIEPTTSKTYGALAKELAMIKTFASGILIRKEFIWPIGKDGYLQPATNLVKDAHKLGLEVYASGFANDAMAGYNYSYDPISEYLQFIDNGQFAVDGVLSDFSPSASQAIACYSSIRNKGKPLPGISAETLVISRNGASGDYPGSTDLAYQGAIDSGADVIDCTVQLTKDGVAFCTQEVDLLTSTTVITGFSARTASAPEIQLEPGIFSFDLTWAEIQTLKPQIISPFISSGLTRNPAFKNKGKILSLSEFLEFAKAKAVTGIMITIENAAYLASKKGLDMVGTVSTALINATFDKQSTQRVFIKSDDTSVLSVFKTNFPNFIRVLNFDTKFGSVPKNVLEEIKRYAQTVAIPRASVIEITNYFTTGLTEVVAQMKAANLSVFVYVMRNEYVSLAFDFYSEASMEVSTYVDYFHVDGIITEFPNTAKRYLTCPCRPVQEDLDSNSYLILPPEVGALLQIAPPRVRPKTDPPLPPLESRDIADPPLPPLSEGSSTTNSTAGGPAAAATPSTAVTNVANLFISLLSVAVLTFLHSHSAL